MTGFLLSGALIGGIIVVSVDNEGLRYWGVPKWIRWIDCVINTVISLVLVILMMSMYRIYDKFLQGEMRRTMKDTKIRKFFVIFTLSYVYLTLVQIISAAQDWQISGDPLNYPFSVQMASFSI